MYTGSISSSPTILHVLPGHLLGGADRQAISVAKGLHSRYGYRSRFAFLSEGSGVQAARDAGLDVHVLDKRFRADVRCSIRLAALARASGTPLLHSHTFGTNFYTRMAALIDPSLVAHPTVRTVHGFDFRNAEHAERVPLQARLMLSQDRWTPFSVRRTVVVSEHMREILVQCGYRREKLDVIYNTVEPPADLEQVHFQAQSLRQRLGICDHPVIGTIGRMVAVKNQHALVGVTEVLRTRGIHVNVLLVGHGPLREQLQREVERQGLTDRVRFLGIRSDALTLIAAMDVFCLPSLYEGIPLAMLEAMSVGTPVIATAVGGVPEVLRPGQTGITVPAGDVTAMADAVQYLLSHPEQAREMTRCAMQTLHRDFPFDGMLSQFARVYQECWKETG